MNNYSFDAEKSKISGIFKNVKTFLLDFDGTLMNKEIYVEMYPHIVNALEKKYGDKVKEAIIELKAKTGEVDTYELCAKLNDLNLYYSILPTFIGKSKLLDGTVDLLKKLNTAGKRVLLITNSHRRTIDLYLVKHDLGKYFDFVWANEDSDFSKSDENYWAELTMATNIIKEESIVISDDLERDVIPARNFGMKALHLGTDIISLKEILQ